MPQILIIEDEAVIRTALRRLLERQRFPDSRGRLSGGDRGP